MDIPKGYVAIPGSERRPARGAKRVADAHPDELVSITIRVRRRPDGPPMPTLNDWAKIPLNQRRYVLREDFARLYGASPEDLAAVTPFAREHGLSVTEQSASTQPSWLSFDLTATFDSSLNGSVTD